MPDLSDSTAAPVHCLHGQGKRPECILCGRCLSVCPLFAATGREELSPRAKFFLARAVAEGRADLSARAAEILATVCLSCGKCESACPLGLCGPDLVAELRASHPGFAGFLWKLWIERAGLMFVIIGIVVVLGCVVGGFLLEGGHLAVLIQPIEVLIIGGAAIGSFLISSPKSVVTGTIKHMLHVFTAKEPSASDYQDLLTLLFELMNIARKDGIVALEPHVNNPEQSATINRYPNIAKNKSLAFFICDNIKALLSEGIEAHRYDDLMRTDIATQHHHGPPRFPQARP